MRTESIRKALVVLNPAGLPMKRPLMWPRPEKGERLTDFRRTSVRVTSGPQVSTAAFTMAPSFRYMTTAVMTATAAQIPAA